MSHVNVSTSANRGFNTNISIRSVHPVVENTVLTANGFGNSGGPFVTNTILTANGPGYSGLRNSGLNHRNRLSTVVANQDARWCNIQYKIRT